MEVMMKEKNQRNSRKIIFFTLFLIFTSFFSLIIPEKNFAEKIDLSKPITVSQALEGHYLGKPVIVKGLFRGSMGFYTLSDSDEVITLDSTLKKATEGFQNQIEVVFKPSVSLLDKIIFDEQNYLLRGGIVEIEAKGILYRKEEIRIGRIIVTKMEIKPSDINFIRKVRCLKKYEAMARPGASSIEEGCFDYSGFNMMPSVACDKLMNSKLFREHNYELTEYFDYSDDEKAWAFQATYEYQPGGCSTYFYVSPNKIVLKRNCADPTNNLFLEE